MKTFIRYCQNFWKSYRTERRYGASIRQSIFWGLVFANLAKPNKTEVI